MKTAFALALVALAGSASAQMISTQPRLLQAGEYTLTSTAINTGEQGNTGPASTPTAAYAGVPGPYTAFGAAAFSQRDDYQVGAPLGANNQVFSFQFVGGVAAANGILDVFFLDSGAVGGTPNVVSSFGIALPSAGNFIWTITFNPAVAPRPTILDNGGVQIQSRTGSTGTWFFTTTAPTVGTNNFAVGTGGTLSPQRNQAFAITTIPTPGALALLGLSGLVVARRRR